MLTCALFLNLLGVWCHYLTSKKIKIDSTRLEDWLQNHSRLAIIFNIALQIFSFSILIYTYSWATSLFVFIVFFMLSTSLLVLGRPLKLPTNYYLLVIFLLGIFIENIV
ncbi:hypothetical protein [Zunongwangia sp.]|uniref:hypothetical protein n=1 Tax=Zunongwangia sp. TaxID=1965325 RepID=UPI003AA8A791